MRSTWTHCVGYWAFTVCIQSDTNLSYRCHHHHQFTISVTDIQTCAQLYIRGWYTHWSQTTAQHARTVAE